MKILAIETSCDDTAVAVVEFSGKKIRILSDIVSSQTEIHKQFGGVHPSLAKREHEKNLPIIFKNLDSRLRGNDIEAIAITVGPGLDPCLWTGVEFAKKIAKENKLPIIPVNHIEAHILVNFLEKKPRLPAVALVISGGHTQLILMEKIGKYKIIGETRDDAVGECFDKAARILGLGYPGGPAIAAQAQKNFAISPFRDIALPRPMIYSKDYDFSFSGLKTAVLYNFKKQKEITPEYLSAMSKEIQQAAIDILIKKTLKAVRDYGVKTIILGGGVSANEELRKQFKQKFKNTIFPEKHFSTDNAVMIAIAGFYHKSKATRQYSKIKALPNLRV